MCKWSIDSNRSKTFTNCECWTIPVLTLPLGLRQPQKPSVLGESSIAEAMLSAVRDLGIWGDLSKMEGKHPVRLFISWNFNDLWTIIDFNGKNTWLFLGDWPLLIAWSKIDDSMYCILVPSVGGWGGRFLEWGFQWSCSWGIGIYGICQLHGIMVWTGRHQTTCVVILLATYCICIFWIVLFWPDTSCNQPDVCPFQICESQKFNGQSNGRSMS